MGERYGRPATTPLHCTYGDLQLLLANIRPTPILGVTHEVAFCQQTAVEPFPTKLSAVSDDYLNKPLALPHYKQVSGESTSNDVSRLITVAYIYLVLLCGVVSYYRVLLTL